jgi:hypothetical protein
MPEYTPEEIEKAKQKAREINEQEKARVDRERPRTYAERLQDMGRLPKPSGGGSSGTGSAGEIKALTNPRAMKKGGKISSASKRADGCCQRGKTKGRMV